MAERLDRKRLRVRRTLAPGGSALPRSLWGVAPGDVHTALEQQQEAHAGEAVALDGAIRAEQSRCEELKQEIERQRQRLQSLRGIVEVLRGKLAHERAARAVLATRLLDRQSEEQRAAETTRLESVRLQADIRQEHEAVRQLVASLYRSIAGRRGVPSDLDLLAEIPPEPAARFGSQTPAAEWHRFLLGKKAGRELRAPGGRVVLQEGETIGPDELQAAEAEGLLFELILTARLAERLPDL